MFSRITLLLIIVSFLKVIENYDKMSDDEAKDAYLYENIGKLTCDGCGLPITGAFSTVPSARNIMGRTLFFHLFPASDRICKLRTCNKCGSLVNQVTRTCSICQIELTPTQKECPECFRKNTITVSSRCKSCNTENKQELTKQIDG